MVTEKDVMMFGNMNSNGGISSLDPLEKMHPVGFNTDNINSLLYIDFRALNQGKYLEL